MKELKDCKNCSSRQFGAFGCVGSGTLESISNEKTVLHFKKKEIIIHDEENANGFYCIKTGSVRTYKISSTGKDQTFQIQGKGGWIGFRDMISGDSFKQEVICLEDTEVCYIRKDLVTKLIKHDEKFQLEVLKYLASGWKESENQMYSLATKQANSRIAELILTFQNAAGNTNEFGIHLTREIIASCIGITTEALIRALSEFKKKRIFKIEKGKVTILNQDALEDYIIH